MKRCLFFISLLFFTLHVGFSQEYLSVPLGDPVYFLLDNAVQRNVLPSIPSSRPYSEAKVRELLSLLELQVDKLSPRERETLTYFQERFQKSYTGPKYGNFAAEGPLGTFRAGMKFESDYRLNFNNPESWHMYNGIIAYMQGDIGSNFSYYGHAGGSIDKVAPDYFYKYLTMEITKEEFGPTHSIYYIEDNQVQAFTGKVKDYTPPGGFAPYHFSKSWEGHHNSPFFSKGHTHHDGVTGLPSIALTIRDEITGSFYGGNLLFRFGGMRREWGNGDGSLYLSGTARPFEGFETHLSPASWFEYSWIVGSLGNWFVDSYLVTDPTAEVPDNPVGEYFSEQKMLTLQQFRILPTDWLSFIVSSSAIWGKRFEMAYLSPLLLPMMTQELNGDMDNVAITFGFSMRLPVVGSLYGSLFLDEASASNIENLFSYARNLYAYQGGLKRTLPWIPFSTITLQYTKINPFVYSHYVEENYATFSVPVSMTYAHDGENLGYYLPPNADEILLKIESLPRPNLHVTGAYKLIRHGTNDYDPVTQEAQIYGDIYIPFDYTRAGEYPLKDFLRDGVYDWSNIVSLKGEYTFPDYPLTLGLEYIFAHTFWDTNGLPVTTPGSITQNIISFSFTLFH